MLASIHEESVCLVVHKTTVLWRVVFHVAKELVGEEVKEPWSFTVVKVSTEGDESTEVKGVASVETFSFKVFKNGWLQPYL